MALDIAVQVLLFAEEKKQLWMNIVGMKVTGSSKEFKKRVQDFQKYFAILCPIMLDFGMKIAHIFWKLESFSGQEVSHN